MNAQQAARSGTVRACWLALAATLLAFGIGLEYQSRIPVNHDVGWIVHSAALLLEGGEVGRDIVDPSPPTAWFASLPAAWIHKIGLADEPMAVLAYFWLLALAAQLLTIRVLLLAHRETGLPETVALAAATAIAVFFLPSAILGQRDVVATAFAFPYLLLVAARLQGKAEISPAVAALVGGAAGAGFCLKPYLFAIPLCVELTRAVLQRDLRGLLRPELAAMALAVAICLLAIVLFAPAYIQSALPLIQSTYWAYQESQYWVSRRYLAAIGPAVLAVGIAAATRRLSRLQLVLLAALAGASLSYWLQHKAFSYHAYPVSAIATVLLVHATVAGIRSCAQHLADLRRSVRLAAAGALLYLGFVGLGLPVERALAAYRTFDLESGDRGREIAELIGRLRALGAGTGTGMFALSTHPMPGFPTVNYLGARWVGPAATQFWIPAYVRRDELADAELRRSIEADALAQRAALAGLMRRSAPEFVMLEGAPRRLGLGYRKFDDLAFYLGDPAFAEVWSCYRLADTVHRVRIFVRRADRCAVEPAG